MHLTTRTSVPTFLNASALTVTAAFRREDFDDLSVVEATDPEGDKMTFVHHRIGISDSDIYVAYQESGQEAPKAAQPSQKEAYQIYRGLDDAQRQGRIEEKVDSGVLGFVIADLAGKSGAGGAA